MPILWRYLLSHYLKVLLLCVVAFVSILLTTRLDEIAHFATMGPEGVAILMFTLHQIPYILPIAIPVSCLISAMLLMQRLSHTHELTALRAAGLSLSNVLCPILIMAAALSLGNFYIVSELSTQSHLTTGKLKNELRSLNPLLLLHNKHILKLKGIFFNALGETRMGEKASNVIIALPNKNNKSIHILLAKDLITSSSDFVGNGVTLLTSYNRDELPLSRQQPEFLYTENIDEAFTTALDFSQLIYKKVWTLNNDHLRMPLLLIRLSEPTQMQRDFNRAVSEILRRISVAGAALTFTLMGIAFGISTGRQRTQRPLFCVLCLSTLYLVCFFMAKNYDYSWLLAGTLYLMPHFLIVALSLKRLQNVTEGATC